MSGPLAAAVLAAAAAAVPAAVRTGDLFVVEPPATAECLAEAAFMEQRYPPVVPPGGEPFFLVGVDLEAGPGTYPLEVRCREGGELLHRAAVEVREREFPVERLTLPPAMVTPPEEVLERIAREREAAAAVYRGSAPGALWAPPFARPVDGSPSGNFGRRRILNGQPRSPHSGEDYRAPRGSPVRSSAAGVVRMAEDLYYSGKTVLVDHGAGLVSQYFHLDEMLVVEGRRVERGEPVGTVGATGRVTGPHLHFGLRLYEKRVDPSLLWEIFPAP